jgi:hypothetical protein
VLSSLSLSTPEAVSALAQIDSLARSSPNNNLVVVVSSAAALSSAPGAPPGGAAWFWERRCAVIEGRVKLMDAGRRVLMLEDERIIEFDGCVIASEGEV